MRGLAILRAVAPFLRPQWRLLAGAVAVAIAMSGLALLTPWPLKFLIDDVLHVNDDRAPDASWGVLLAIAGAFVGLALLRGVLSFLNSYLIVGAGQRIGFDMRRAVFSHLQRLPLSFHDRHRTGDLLTRLTSDVTRVQEMATQDLLTGAVTSVVQLGGIIVVMLVIDWQLGLVALVSAPPIFLTTLFFRRRIRRTSVAVREKEGDSTSLAQETISSIRLVKAFGRERFHTRKFEEATEEMLEAELRVVRLEGAFGWVLGVVSALALAAVVVVGTRRVLAGAVSAGTLVVFIQYMRDLQGPLLSLSRLSAKLAKTRVRLDRILEVLHEPSHLGDPHRGVHVERLRGEIELDGVSFSYDGRNPVLRDVDLTVAPAERIAIVGATGAGKSTLAGLVLRLYDPDTGVVRLDGRDARDYAAEVIVDQVAVVLQESLLFQTTIRENIAYGNPKATFEEIRAAAEAAHCDEFIRRLPNGYDTVVGERGTTLSGGQRQRIAIARAMIRDAPILVLDEPTTGLDAESEDVVLRALERLMAGRSTVMIAHKLSTTRLVDRIYVLDGGRVAESGTHEELLELGGAYARAYRAQSSAYAGVNGSGDHGSNGHLRAGRAAEYRLGPWRAES